MVDSDMRTSPDPDARARLTERKAALLDRNAVEGAAPRQPSRRKRPAPSPPSSAPKQRRHATKTGTDSLGAAVCDAFSVPLSVLAVIL
jgi:hypothetical protein